MTIVVNNKSNTSLQAKVEAGNFPASIGHNTGWFTVGPGQTARWSRDTLCKITILISGTTWEARLWETVVNVHSANNITTGGLV
jgi:hypothetical protein